MPRPASRTPEGDPGRCLICGHDNSIEFSDPADDATCPQCGVLLWRSARLRKSLDGLHGQEGLDLRDIQDVLGVRDGLDVLGERLLEIVVMRNCLKLQFDVIAERMGTSQGACRMMHAKAMQVLGQMGL